MKWIKCALFILGFWGASRFCDRYTQGFTVASIDSNIPNMPSFAVKEPETLELSGPFTYMNRGGQSYVFLSHDKKSVLKFFKKTHAIPDEWVTSLDLVLPEKLRKYRLRFLPTREERFRTIFSSCKLAYETLRNETGLLYLHLTPSTKPLPSVTILDAMGNPHTINLNTTSFVVQKRGRLFFSVLKKQVASGDFEGAKKSIRKMIEYLSIRCKKGIRDTDNALRRNYGYIGSDAASIDIGSFIFDPLLQEKKARSKELFRKTRQLRKWLKNHCTELMPYYENLLQETADS